MFRVALLASVILSAADARADAPIKPVRLGLCTACHGENGIGITIGTPHLAGQDERYLIDALGQYRSGERTAAPMRAAVGALSANDIDALARWYSAQPRCTSTEGVAR